MSSNKNKAWNLDSLKKLKNLIFFAQNVINKDRFVCINTKLL